MPLDAAVIDGQLNPANAAYVLEQLRRSADYAMSGKKCRGSHGTCAKIGH